MICESFLPQRTALGNSFFFSDEALAELNGDEQNGADEEEEDDDEEEIDLENKSDFEKQQILVTITLHVAHLHADSVS